MKIFSKSPDGGVNSGVTAYFLIEWKGLFSIALLRFSAGSREAFHSHAFNAITWWLKGEVLEYYYPTKPGDFKEFKASFKPKFTPRECFHKIVAMRPAWALTFRGPWAKEWKEYHTKTEETITLTHGRKQV